MATKLDEAIARVAVVRGQDGWNAMIPLGAQVASQLTPKDISKLPDRWAPKVSANKAGVPEFEDSWEFLWFEALAEILVQCGRAGLPGLLGLMERDGCTYHHFVIVRVLRLAADGIDRDELLERVRRRFETLQHVWTRASVNEVKNWMMIDRRPLDLLQPMAGIVVPRTDGETIGTYLGVMGPEWASRQNSTPVS